MSGFTGEPAAALRLLLTTSAAFAVCAAYRAQQTRRNPWLWFFSSLSPMPLTGPVRRMLDRDRPSAPAIADHGHLLSIRNDLP